MSESTDALAPVRLVTFEPPPRRVPISRTRDSVLAAALVYATDAFRHASERCTLAGHYSDPITVEEAETAARDAREELDAPAPLGFRE